jgi:hypothetical protein
MSQGSRLTQRCEVWAQKAGKLWEKNEGFPDVTERVQQGSMRQINPWINHDCVILIQSLSISLYSHLGLYLQPRVTLVCR